MFYTISNDNAITSHDTFAQATAALGATPEANALPATNNGTILFQTSKEFTAFTMNCPVDRLVQIWNGLAVSAFGKQGKLKPVSKFENRQVATVRIWKAIQSLNGTAGGPASEADMEAAAAAPKAKKAPKAKPADAPAPKASKSAKKESPMASKPAKAAKATKPAAKKEAAAPREGSKQAKVIAMMQRKGGATLDSIVKETGWQAHTVRGFVSILGSKYGLKIASSKRESDGARVYSVE